ncbi:MAG: peptide ABC transporter substrate-binding protein [Chloroflexi bacterium]|nr:peptide ABC transporter substrate-binding protein [Chloroflexota bacterium]
MKRLLYLVAALVVLGLLLAACGPTPTPQTVTKEVTKVVQKEVTKVVQEQVVVTATPVPGEKHNTLYGILGTEPPTLDPSLATDTTSVWVDEQLFLGLTAFDANGKVTPELAKSWDVSDDGTVYTFHMRDDAHWYHLNLATNEFEDVGPVTAFDVEYGVKRTINPKTASDYAYVLGIIKGANDFNGADPAADNFADMEAAVGVTAVDTYTVQFTLTHPAGYFPAIAGMWIARPLPKDTINEYGDRWTEPGLIVTNGAYGLKEWTHGAHLTMVKNPNWYGWANSKGNIEVIDMPIVQEASTTMSMYEAGEIDFLGDPGWGPPLPDMDRIKADATLSKELVIKPRLCTYYYGFINSKPPFDDPSVRKAFSLAIDRQSLIDNVLKGGQQPAHTFAPKGIFGNQVDNMDIAPDLLDYSKGLPEAQKLLADAGYPEGEGLDVVLMHNTSEGHAQIAQAIQDMWATAFPKANISIENQEWKVYLKTLLPDAPDSEKPNIYRLGWCADYPDENNWVNEVFNSKSDSNYAKYNNPEFDKIVEEAEKEQDPAKRSALYAQAEKLLVDTDAAIAPIYYYTRIQMTKPYLQRVTNPMGGDPVDQWVLDVAAQAAGRK